MLKDPVIIFVLLSIIGAGFATYYILDLGETHESYQMFRYEWSR